MIKSISSFVACSKRTIGKSPVTKKMSNEITVEAYSDLRKSRERSRLRGHLRQSFDLGRSSSPCHFGESRKHSNESRSSVLLKLKPELDNDAQTNETIGVASSGGFVRRGSPVPSLRPQTAGQGLVGRGSPFARRFSAATTKRTHAALPWLSPVQTKPQWLLPACARTRALATAFPMSNTPSFRSAIPLGTQGSSLSSSAPPLKATAPLLAWPAAVLLVALCFHLVRYRAAHA